ncbi:DUF7344 domain-containing protein [Natronorubrum thiooxidans]|uniref:DUF7344 domain-containing protein n=1 Tax=Natronorubrum thiooxidans TaxID=308853 RepID=A0A1N7ENQ2_9EURY|nr:transcriptional regulator [Natronorubrum thiooxidans]SIR89689.1 hypothetical protein SAMN05421752_104293 [Natronorubrum thiooxidans]
MLPVTADPESLTPPSSTGLTDETDATVELLADQRRRAVLRYLDDHDNPVSLSDLTEHVTLEQRGRASSRVAATGDALLGTRRRVQLSLRHVHLPKLAAAHAIEYDTDTNTVSLCEQAVELLDRV